MGARESKAVVREYFRAWDGRDPEAIAGCFADDFSTAYTTPSGETVRVASDEIEAWIRGWLGTIKEMTHEIEHLVAEGPEVMATVTYTGVHAGTVFGVEPTGNRVEVEEWLYFLVEDGEIVSLEWLGDDVGLMRQIGVDVPPST